MITKFKITNFRKLKKVEYQFSNNLLITGKNAQGKTSIAEALYFCAFLYSPLTRKKEELISFNNEYSLIELTQKHTIKCMIMKNQLKLMYDNQEIKKASEIIGKFNVVYLDPQTIKLVEGSSQVRRKFLNLQMSQISEQFVETLNAYNKLLKQKRVLLKKSNIDQTYLNIINQELELLNEIIVTTRQEYLVKLVKSTQKIVNWLSESQEEITYKYTKMMSEESLVIKEQKYQTIMWGNHLDKIDFYINGLNVRTYASQGQKRTLAIALNIAQMELIYEQKYEYPLVIIDDIFSELDATRQQKLYQLVSKKSQLIMITPNIQNINSQILNNQKLEKITIDNGEIL